MFQSWSNGWQLVKASWAVLQSDRELVLFPIISGITMIILTAVMLTPMAIIFGLLGDASNVGTEVVAYALLFLYYLVSYSVTFYFQTGLVGATLIRLDGGDPTVADGFRIANSKFGKIIGYAAIASTVGMILRAIERNGIIGAIVASIIGLAWNLITYLTVPVLVAEDVGPIDAVKRSGTLLRNTWGEQITGNFSMGGIFFLLYLATIVLGGALISLAIGLEMAILVAFLVILLVAAIITLAVLQSALSGIYQAALYRFAESGTAPDNFDIQLLRNTFVEKKKKR